MITARVRPISLDRMITLNRVIDQALGAAPSTAPPARVWTPAMDVAERGDAYVVKAELPGVRPDQVEVSFEQNVLTIRGTKAAGFEPEREEEIRLVAAERAFGAFERAVRLPEYVDGERVDATFTHGLLTVTVPKAEAAKPRRIELRTAD